MTKENVKFLITTPESDDVIFYCSVWSKEIIEEAKKKNFSVTNLEKKKANRANFEGHVNKQKPDFVMFNGHGLSDLILGDETEILLRKGENEQLMDGKIVYARSCSALSELGDACIKTGAKAFVSYYIPFTFVSDPNRSAHPLKDELAAPCLITSNMVALSLIKGQTVVEAVQKAKIRMQELLEYWETKHDLVEAPFVAMCLHWNKVALGFVGEGNTKL